MIREYLQKSDLFKSFLDFALPPLCLGCGAFCDNDIHVCNRCDHRISTINHPICLRCHNIIPTLPCQLCKAEQFPLMVYGNYSDPLDEIIIQFKFKGITSPASIFADRIVNKHRKIIDQLKADVLVPIPLYPSREKQRGYNQAELLAEKLSALINLPVNNALLYRIKKRKPQAKSKMAERGKNIKNVFKVNPDIEKRYRIILMDDVVTSGATMREASLTLSKAGHKVVGAIAIAHAE